MAEGDCEVNLPRELNVIEFAKCRAKEMAAMEKAAQVVAGNNLVAQRVPRHMRRRAAGHDIRRLPRRLRELAKKEMMQGGATPKITKRPSRKHRRRPKNLLSEYQRRQREHVWLETHIWHAKRFHMDSLWGYKVPLHANDKGARAAYRGAANHCLLQDKSYTCCIEVQGSEQEIIDGLSHLTSSETGPTFNAKMTKDGCREGHLILYAKDKFPYGALCNASFMWKPVIDVPEGKPDNRQLWIWVHPSAYSAVIQELCSVFNAKANEPTPVSSTSATETSSENNPDTELSNSLMKQDLCDIKKKCGTGNNSGVVKNPCYSSGIIEVRSLKDELCRFRLTGPTSQTVLTQALLTATDISSPTQSNTPSDDDVSDGITSTQTPWWKYFFLSSTSQNVYLRQMELWKTMADCSSPSDVHPFTVVGLTVRDPRLFIPHKKTSIGQLKCDKPYIAVSSAGPTTSFSPLWESSIRHHVKETKMTDHSLNIERSKLLVPGTVPDLGDAESRIPLLLVQRPGARSHMGSSSARATQSFACGWDLILPAGWGMAFWVALIYGGARAVGLKEELNVCLEEGRLPFPSMFPDTAAGEASEAREAQQREEKFNRMPPAKRPNFVKLGRVAPFHNPWRQLVGEWTGSKTMVSSAGTESSFYILRHIKALRILHNRCCGKIQDVAVKDGPPSAKVQKIAPGVRDLLDVPPDCLVAVEVTMVARGIPSYLAAICVTTTEDIHQLSKSSSYGGPTEPLHVDPSKLTKTKQKECVKKECAAGVSEVSARSCASRQVIGYVSLGRFMLGRGRAAGTGFVTLQGLETVLDQHLKKKPAIVLIREANSLQYRFAYLSVMI